jgi:hypothetical protein
MNNTLGLQGYGAQTWEFPFAKPPKYTVVYYGSQTNCNTSGSVYHAKGWDVKYTSGDLGDAYTMTATLNQEVGSDGITPLTTLGSYTTLNFSLHYNNSEKELLFAGVNVIPWINNISTKDKTTLESLISNPPTNATALGYSSTSADFGVNWNNTDPNSLFTGSSATSISASQVVWTMANNGFKTVPIIQPVLRMNIVVPAGYNMSTFTSNLLSIYSQATMVSEINLPSNWNSVLPYNSDPSPLTAAGNGASIPLLYGWLKQTPDMNGNGSTITVNQDFIYGCWYQNVYGTRI